MKLSELLKTIQPVQVTGSTEKDITGVNIDSRLVAAGHLFMAMRGTQTAATHTSRQLSKRAP